MQILGGLFFFSKTQPDLCQLYIGNPMQILGGGLFLQHLPFEFLKSMESHLSLEQKIKVIAVLDNLLAVFKISSLYIVENRDFQLYHVKI